MKRWIASVIGGLAVAALSMGAAAAERAVAQLRTPAPQKTKFIAGAVMFVCEGSRCVAGGANDRTVTLATCKQLARRFGAVESLADALRQLDAAKLAACNAGVGAN